MDDGYKTWIMDYDCVNAVQVSGWALSHVFTQTPEICIEAVKQNGLVLDLVKEQTHEICLEAVKQTGWALEYVKEQTPEICIEAINNNFGCSIWINIPLTGELEREMIILSI